MAVATVSVREKEDDLVAFTFGNLEFAGFPETREISMCVSDLAERGLERTSWNVLGAVLRVES
ncbi:MAG: hypothetical protein IIC03_03740, partial [Proteobacteria bacterium]|nr:hypothetical protein [Pseudomonadota bacterium]